MSFTIAQGFDRFSVSFENGHTIMIECPQTDPAIIDSLFSFGTGVTNRHDMQDGDYRVVMERKNDGAIQVTSWDENFSAGSMTFPSTLSDACVEIVEIVKNVKNSSGSSGSDFLGDAFADGPIQFSVFKPDGLGHRHYQMTK